MAFVVAVAPVLPVAVPVAPAAVAVPASAIVAAAFFALYSAGVITVVYAGKSTIELVLAPHGGTVTLPGISLRACVPGTPDGRASGFHHFVPSIGSLYFDAQVSGAVSRIVQFPSWVFAFSENDCCALVMSFSSVAKNLSKPMLERLEFGQMLKTLLRSCPVLQQLQSNVSEALTAAQTGMSAMDRSVILPYTCPRLHAFFVSC